MTTSSIRKSIRVHGLGLLLCATSTLSFQAHHVLHLHHGRRHPIHQQIQNTSGVGALVFSLVSKDLASALVSGFIVQAWDGFEVGDDVCLGDGTEGTVKKIGLVETELQSFDNIVQRIPNSQLTNTRVSNLSRMKKSRVNQKLRFKYQDLNKLPKVLGDIKAEIADSCPALISDGSKSFQALLVEYASDYISAVVNCHFSIPVASREYADNRQTVLLAIARAVERNGVSFALPSIVYRNEDNANS